MMTTFSAFCCGVKGEAQEADVEAWLLKSRVHKLVAMKNGKFLGGDSPPRERSEEMLEHELGDYFVRS
jgi:hypothetical protein